MDRRNSQCPYCYTVTGEHGFAINSQGNYKEEEKFVLDPEFEPYFTPITEEEWDVIHRAMGS